MSLKLDERKVVIETEMMPLKCIKEKYRSSVAFVLENDDVIKFAIFMLRSPTLYGCSDPNPEIECTYYLKSAFPIAWMILQTCQRVDPKVGYNLDKKS